MVADDVRQGGFLYIALDTQQVEESLIALGGLGSLVGRQHGCKLHGQQIGIDPFVLGISRMYADALAMNLGRSGIEILEFQFTYVTAIHGIGPLAAELGDVEMVSAHADFLVGIEGHTNLAVLDFLVLLQVDHCLYDFGNTCLVVGTEQCGTVGHDEVFTDVLQQFRKLFRTGHDSFAQQDVAAVVVSDNLWLDVGSRAVGAGVVMGNEADGGNFALDI